MRKIIGYFFVAIGSWMLLSPQSLTGIKYLKWMHEYAFPGEVMVGMLVFCIAFYFLDFKANVPSKPEH
ncbi:MAG: hypothetical protein RRY29_04250 [Desulfovibrionaceae bacterium]